MADKFLSIITVALPQHVWVINNWVKLASKLRKE
jgi:hypothetical protein